jgi:hypothetical protein
VSTPSPDDLGNDAVAALIAGLATGLIIGWNAGVRLASRIWRHVTDYARARPPDDPT